MMKYKESDRVRIKSLDWYNENKNKFGKVWTSGEQIPFDKCMSEWCGKVMTISHVRADHYTMVEDLVGYWTDEMIEGLVEEETKPEFDYVTAMNDLFGLDIERSCILEEYDEYKKAVEEHGYYSEEALTRKYFIHLRKIGTAQNVLESFGFNLPDGHIFKDENGNVINANRIVLEKLVVPKFKVGDKVKDKNNRVWFIVRVSETFFDISSIPVPNAQGYFVPMEDQDDYELVPQCFSNDI